VQRGAGTRTRASALISALAICLALPLAGCSDRKESLERTSAERSGSGTPAPSGDSSAASSDGGSATAASTKYSVEDPGRLQTPLRTPDILLSSTKPISDAMRRRVSSVAGVTQAVPLSIASVSTNGRTLRVAAGDPAQIRRFTPVASASADDVWKRVAGGELAVDPSLPRKLLDKGYLRLGSSGSAPEVHVGAFAPLVKQISVVMNDKRAEQLGMPRGNAMLVSTGVLTPSAVKGKLQKVLDKGVTMQTLALEFNDPVQTAVLSGGSVSEAVGTFNYTPHPDGTVTPDPRWVSTYIRRETMPIIGPVTGNKGMLPQLKAALSEILRTPGLAAAIHPSQYGGCYVPRFIANDPSKGLSLHSWGMAVDLNVPENQRGTVGAMNRQVVAIFKKWGFAWGGDWNYTDPMHFEMDRVVKAG
jgi:D-alanyl-D-alanine carboxypeptidase